MPAWKGPKPPIERVLMRVDKTETCWLWTGAIRYNGYGMYNHRAAHRVLYELLVGPIPEGLHLDHLCRVRNCVNPAHLEPVTQQENNRRAGAAKTHCINGHEYTRENTYRKPVSGRRECRTCHRQRVAAAKARERVAA